MRLKVTQLFILTLLVFCLAPSTSMANLQFGANDITVTTNPDNPQAYTHVTISLSCFSTDLNRAQIEWKSGGQTILSGIGKTQYSFTTGGPNTSNNFTVNIVPDGVTDIITKNIAIQPSDIDILWQSLDSYTPPFYKGKALPTAGGAIRVVAFPNTVGLSTDKNKSMVYQWTQEYDNVGSASGYAKNSYIFQNSQSRNVEHIGVTVSGVGNSYNATGNIDIPISNPQMIFYNKSATDGILYENAIVGETTLASTDDAMTLVAEPYFLALKGNEGDFSYSWKVNDADIDTPKKPREITIRPTARGGFATINLTMESMSKLFQSVGKTLTINL